MLIQTTLDIIGRAVLGVELGSLSSSSSTPYHLYRLMLNLRPVGQLIFMLNSFILVRRWLLGKINREFVYASKEVRRLVMATIQERKKELEERDIKSKFTEEGRTDILMYMLRERNEGGINWSDEDILHHVGLPSSST